MEDEKTITLRKTVKIGDAEFTELVLREATAGELAKANKASDEVDAAITLISMIAKVPRGAIEKICQRDFQEANNFLSSFTADGQTTGVTS